MKKILVITLLAISFLICSSCASSISIQSTPLSPSSTPQFPLEGKIFFGVAVKKDVISLSLQTEKDYGWGTTIKTTLVTDKPLYLEIDIYYIYHPTWPTVIPANGPASYNVVLGEISGSYDLSFSYNNTVDKYQITFEPDKISVTPINNQFTIPLHEIWQRFSPDTIWFNTFSVESTVIQDPEFKYMDRQEYQAYADNFFKRLEALGAKRFYPEEGFYPYIGFIPPWSTKQIIEGDSVKVIDPDNHSVFWLMKWPDIRFYHYSEPYDEITRFIESKYAIQSTQLWIEYYNTEKRLYPYNK